MGAQRPTQAWRHCWGNACAGSFFKTLKRELEELDGKKNRREVRGAVFEYVEAYYNLRSRNDVFWKETSLCLK
jgi:transposase InsO family protein